MRAKGVLFFLVISFGLAWASILLLTLFGVSLDNPLAQLPMAFSPAIAALVVRRFITKEGFADAGLAVRFRSAWRWYLTAWLIPVGLLGTTVALAVAIGTPHRLPDALPAVGALALVTFLLPPIFWGEEFGWRSYLQQRISDRPLVAVLATAFIWAVWHWPLVFAGYTSYGNVTLGLGLWTLQTVLFAIVLAWLFMRSGSIWVPSLAHAGSNMLVGVGSEIVLIEGGGLSRAQVDALSLAPLAVLALLVLAIGRLRQNTPASHPRPAAAAPEPSSA